MSKHIPLNMLNNFQKLFLFFCMLLTGSLSTIVAEETVQSRELTGDKWLHQASKNLQDYRKIYESSYAFPGWVQGYIRNEKLYNQHAQKAKIYAPGKAAKKFGTNEEVWKHVNRLAREREPCNITMGRHYSGKKLEKEFGWKKSGYINYYKEEAKKKDGPKLGLNLAIYSPVAFIPYIHEYDLDSYGVPEEIAKKYKNKVKEDINDPSFDETLSQTVHMISVIAPAFDIKKQVDAKYFLDENSGYKKVKDEKKEELDEFYEHIFDHIFFCTIQGGFTTIVISKFGTVSFAKLLGKKHVAAIWRRIFIRSFNKWKELLINANVKEVSFMGAKSNDDASLWELIKDAGFGYKYYGFIPYMWMKGDGLFEHGGFDKTLFVNAWDPHTSYGNGNYNDVSLDGEAGRNSSGIATKWPLSNRYLTRNIYLVPNDQPNSTGIKLVPPTHETDLQDKNKTKGNEGNTKELEGGQDGNNKELLDGQNGDDEELLNDQGGNNEELLNIQDGHDTEKKELLNVQDGHDTEKKELQNDQYVESGIEDSKGGKKNEDTQQQKNEENNSRKKNNQENSWPTGQQLLWGGIIIALIVGGIAAVYAWFNGANNEAVIQE